jgi:hypothetical protein
VEARKSARTSRGRKGEGVGDESYFGLFENLGFG